MTLPQTPDGGNTMLLEIQQLTVSHGNRPVLDRLSLTLSAGEILAVIGPNGAGKTTLVRAISGVIPIQGGQIRWNSADLAKFPPASRARCMAVVPQARNLPADFTVQQTVLLGRTPYLGWLGRDTDEDRSAVRQAMERTDTLALAERRMGELSGGEQQRVLLARALAQQAPLLLLDEPTTHLDLAYQVSLMDSIRDLAHPASRGGDSPAALGALVVMHDLHLVARYADRVALLVNGRLAALGYPAEVLTPEQVSSGFGLPQATVEELLHQPAAVANSLPG